ncbi:HpcH/HpaI aldolase/citrate lyase family protein [Bordetella genomosp. 4]|uniref:CoA ester lyase n=1 Tax=Bordetella genomosp. 4 TaxID=463044 RepID=A0A261TMG7_9BORD|nr:CoA ester lyase [Bordetella genomosp. 4]OZI43319.1 CoA ester lyase [Bordetella genomosp. 4]OZI50856.1 CoA ester lyase [Bordetella genomosp. 4]
MRSKLFVPASRPELFAKALKSAADAICFDLEDAVLESKKAYARDCLASFFSTDEFHSLRQEGRKSIIVRVNALETGHTENDLMVACVAGVDILNIPKTDTVEDVRRFTAMLDARAEQTARAGEKLDIRVLANIETPRALLNAAEIAAAHPQVWGLQLGLGDLFEPLGIAREDAQNVHSVMMQMRIAAGAAGKIAYDTAYTNVANAEGYRQEAWRARQVGFLGKTCIHPNQVAIANDVFSPTEAEIRWAAKVVESAEQNDVNGAYMLEGKMIDGPFIERARVILAQSGGR